MEQLAFEYASIGQTYLNLIYYGIVVLGGAIGGYLDTNKKAWSRIPFLMAIGAIMALVALLNYGLFHLIVPAAKFGFFWVALVVDHSIVACAGAALAYCAKARSRDVFGHNIGAALAFIPLAGLYLLLKEGRLQGPRIHKAFPSRFRGGIGIAIGIVLIICSVGIRTYTEQQIVQLQAQRNAAANKKLTELEANLENYLVAVVATIETPRPIDDLTTLTQMRVDKTTMVYMYEINIGTEGIALDKRMKIIKDTCEYDFFVEILKFGGTIKHEYYALDGAPITDISVSPNICGY